LDQIIASQTVRLKNFNFLFVYFISNHSVGDIYIVIQVLINVATALFDGLFCVYVCHLFLAINSNSIYS